MDKKIVLKQFNELQKKKGNMRLAAEKWPTKFQTLISIILSARTRDEVTIKTCKKLFKKYGTAEKLAKAKLSEIKKLIKPVNFYKNKSKNILNCSQILANKSKISNKINELIKLPGVGRKTANVFLAKYGGSNVGVDTHVSYISQKLGWTDNKNPKKIEEDLQKIFPRKYLAKINRTLVSFGKKYTSKREKDKILEEIKKVR